MITEMLYTQDLLAAVQEENVRLVSRLVQQGIDLNISTQTGWTPLMLALLQEHRGIAELLLKNGADPNRATQSEENPSRSPLTVAVANGKLEAVRLLIAYNVDIDALDCNGLTALDLARKLALRPFHKEALAGIISLLNERVTEKAPQHSSVSSQPQSSAL